MQFETVGTCNKLHKKIKLIKNTEVLQMLLSKLLREESGQGMAEYGLILALVAVLCIGAFKLLGDGIHKNLNNVTDALDDPSAVTTTTP